MASRGERSLTVARMSEGKMSDELTDARPMARTFGRVGARPCNRAPSPWSVERRASGAHSRRYVLPHVAHPVRELPSGESFFWCRR